MATKPKLPIKIIQHSKISSPGRQKLVIIQQEHHESLDALEDKKYKITMTIEEIN